MSEEQSVSLYSLVSQYNELMRRIAEQGGEITPELDAVLMQVDVKLPEKVEAYNHIIDHFYTDSEFWKKKKDEMYRMQRGCENAALRLEKAIKLACKAMGVTELQGVTHYFKLQGVKKSLIVDEAQLPPQYFEIVQTKVVRSDDIRKVLEMGETVPGAALIDSEPSLRSYKKKADKQTKEKQK